MTLATESVVDLTITFSPPTRKNGGGEEVHKRSLTAVPRSQFEQMKADFERYQSSEQAQENKLYRFSQNGSEVLVALDFDEVMSIAPAER